MAEENKKVKVVVVGSINVDRFLSVPKLPAVGETLTGSDGFQCVGGKGANSAVTASKLGADVTFICCVGSDGAEEYLISELTKYNVNMDFIHQSPKMCGQAYIFTLPDGDNGIVLDSGANRDWPEFTPEQMEVIGNADIILLQREIPESVNIRTAEIAKQNNVPVCLDAGGENTKISEKLLSLVTIFSPNESELSWIVKGSPEEACQKLHEMGVEEILLKLGSKGAFYKKKDEPGINVSSFKVDVVDTTGAGDTFTGAFAVQYAKGAKPKAAVKFACAAGGLCCTKSGTIPSLPSLKDVEAMLLEFNTLDDLC